MKQFAFICLFSLTILAGCATSNYVDVQNQKYRIGAAHGADLGSIGYLRKEGRNLYEQQILPNYSGYSIKIKTDAVMNDEETRKIDTALKAEIEAYKTKLKLIYGGNYWKTVTYHIIQIKSKYDLVKIYNNNPKILNFLKSSKDARIVTGVLIGFGDKESKTLNAGGDLELNTSTVTPSITANYDHTRNFSFDDGAILAYIYDRVCWTTDKKGNLQIQCLITDNPGWDSGACPDGSCIDPRNPPKR